MRIRAWVFAPILLLLAVLLAPSALADTYTDQVAAKFDSQMHVVADPAGRPALENADQLNKQIVTSRWSWSPAPPVWVAAVAPNQTGVTTPDALHNIALAKNPRFSGVILVIDAKGYHVRAYNVPQAVANRVDDFMGQAAKEHRGNPYEATSAFVSKLAGLNVAQGGATTSPQSNNQHHETSWTWLWVLLILVGGGGLAVLLGYLVVRRLRRSREQELAREKVKSSLIDAESGVNDLNNAVLNSDVDVSAEATKAGSSLDSAKQAYKSGDYTSAKAHIRTVNDTVAKGRRKLDQPSGFRYQDTPADPKGYLPDVEAVKATPKSERKQATVTATDPSGNHVTINNNNYSSTRRSGYDNYYGGGYYNGMYFYPGYYPYSFWGPGWGWSPADVLLTEALLDDHWGGNYDRGYDGGYSSPQADTGFSGQDTNDYDSQQSDVGFDGSSLEDSGGSDTTFDGGQSDGGGDVDFDGNASSGGYDSDDDDTGYTPSYADTSSGLDGGGGIDFGGFGDGGGGGGGSDSSGGDFGF